MRDITIYDVGDYTRRRTIYADSGNMAMSPDQEDLMLTLYSGTVQDVPMTDPQQLQRLYFKTQLDSRARSRKRIPEDARTTRSRASARCRSARCSGTKRSRTASSWLRERSSSRKMKLARAAKDEAEQGSSAATKTTDEPDMGIGSAYCSLLKKTGLKELGGADSGEDSVKADDAGETRAVDRGSRGLRSAPQMGTLASPALRSERGRYPARWRKHAFG